MVVVLIIIFVGISVELAAEAVLGCIVVLSESGRALKKKFITATLDGSA